MRGWQVVITVALSVFTVSISSWLFSRSSILGWGFVSLMAVDVIYLVVTELRSRWVRRAAGGEHRGRHRQPDRLPGA